MNKKNSSYKKWVSLLSIPLVTATFIATAGADTYATSPTYQQQLDQGRIELNQNRAELYDHRVQMSPVHAQIYTLQQNILETQYSLDNVTDLLTTTRARLEEVQKELEKAIILREEQQMRFVQRARAMYMNGPTTYLDVLLNAADFTDLMVRMEFINIIIEHDQSLVSDLMETEAIVEAAHEEVTVQEQRYAASQTMYENTVARYQQDLEQLEVLIEQLEEREREMVRGIQAQERANQEFERLIRQQQALQARATAGPSQNAIIVDTGNLNGRMAWPVPGHSRISSPFGPRRSPISGRNETHSGIDIPAPNGRNIIATEAGVVIRSGWQNGFGNTVVIDHGDGMSTVYAHNSRNLVSVGQSVLAGQVIAHIGSTGWSTGPHLHYEVRINGTAVDPMRFLN